MASRRRCARPIRARQRPGGLADGLVETLRLGGGEVRDEAVAVGGARGQTVGRRADARSGSRAAGELAANGAGLFEGVGGGVAGMRARRFERGPARLFFRPRPRPGFPPLPLALPFVFGDAVVASVDNGGDAAPHRLRQAARQRAGALDPPGRLRRIHRGGPVRERGLEPLPGPQPGFRGPHGRLACLVARHDPGDGAAQVFRKRRVGGDAPSSIDRGVRRSGPERVPGTGRPAPGGEPRFGPRGRQTGRHPRLLPGEDAFQPFLQIPGPVRCGFVHGARLDRLAHRRAGFLGQRLQTEPPFLMRMAVRRRGPDVCGIRRRAGGKRTLCIFQPGRDPARLRFGPDAGGLVLPFRPEGLHERGGRLRTDGGFRGNARRRLLADRLQRRQPLARVRLQRLDQLLAVVGQHHRLLARPAQLHIERLLVDQRPGARVQHRDHPVMRLPLRRMHGRGIRVCQMAKLRVVPGEGHLAPVRKPHAERFVPYLQHLRAVSVGEAALPVVARPAQLLALADAQRLRLEQVEPVAQLAARLQVPRPAVAVGKPDPVLLDLHHRAGVVPGDAEMLHVAVEERDVALAPVARVARLRAREVQRHERFEFHRAAAQRTLGFEALAHRLLDLRPERARRHKQRRPGTRLRRQTEPERGRHARDLLRRQFQKIAPETLQRRARLALDHVLDRGLQVRVALPAQLVHLRNAHARLLHLPEGLARLHAPQLPAVAHQHQPRHLQTVRDPEQRAGLRRARQRHLVHHDDRAAIALSQGAERLRIRHAVRHLPAAREEPLQRPAGEARLARERPRRR